MKNRRMVFALSLLVITSTFCLTLTTLPENVRASTLFVGGIGPGNYTSIQGAIDAASPGDTIYVYNGTYSEDIRILRPLSLLGEDRNTTTIEGSTGNTVYVTADWVNITGFSVKWGGPFEDDAGIQLFQVQNCIISNNTLLLNREIGIRLYETQNCKISNNIAYFNNAVAILLEDSDNNTVDNNTAYSNWERGIRLESSNGNLIVNNNVSESTRVGIELYDSANNRILDNILLDNGDYNIHLDSSYNNTLSGNKMDEGGIQLGGGSVEYWNSHTIDTTNTVHGGSVHYWKDAIGGTVPFGAGQVILANCSNVVVRQQNISHSSSGVLLGFSWESMIDNINSSSNVGYGISLFYSNNNSIASSDFHDNWAGVYLHYSEGNTVEGSRVWGNTHGFYFRYSDNNTIDSNNITWSRDTSIMFRTSNNNTVSRNDLSIHSDGISWWYSDNNAIIANTFYGAPWREIRLDSCNNITISHNTFRILSIGISIRVGDNITITNNTILDRGTGITIRESTRVSITDTTMVGNGILISGPFRMEQWNTHSIDNSNTVNGKPVYYWKNVAGGEIPPGAGQVILANCTNVVVEYQDVSNTTAGVQIGFSSNIYVSEISAFSNVLYGYRLRQTHNSIVANSTAYDNYRGFYIQGSNDNIIDNNTVTINRLFGIYLDSSYGNWLFHNNLIDNNANKFDWYFANLWFSDYPSGGNYWSDYTGFDVLNGPLQDQPGSDGLGDTPYVLEFDYVDRYPLMSPYKNLPIRPPIVLGAHLSGGNLEDVTLRWFVSPDDGGGYRNVTGYTIFRGTTYDAQGVGYSLIASLPNGTTEYMDISAGEGDPSNYFYLICSVDPTGNRRCAKDQAGKYTRPLPEGLNLVSVPLIQSDVSIEKVLQTVRFDEAWSYDPSTAEWKWYMAFKPHKGELRTVTHELGLWVNVTEVSNLTVAGIVPSTTTIQLRAGWNLISFPSFNSTYTAGEMKAKTNATRMEGFDSLPPPYFLRVLGDGDVLHTGYGYWVRVESDTTWTVRNS